MVILNAINIAPKAVAQAAMDNLSQLKLTYAPVVKKTIPAVVNIYAQQIIPQQEYFGPFSDPFFRDFFGEDTLSDQQQNRLASSLGSGVLVDPSGIVVTNNHVIKAATAIRVALSDRREFEAKLILADERTDLAVLKIQVEGERLPILALGNSDRLEVGDLVLAIGNPFGVGQTVTSGIVSALARTQASIGDYQFFIQTDAAINPGNSGGALVNMAGELIGINSAIYSRSGGSNGIGFAIPVNMVKTVINSVESGTKIHRPWLGAQLQEITADIAKSLGLTRPEGAIITDLHPQSALAVAGLKRGDVILKIEDKDIIDAKELEYRFATSEIGKTATIIYRRQGRDYSTKITFIAAPETVKRSETILTGNHPLGGLVVANLSPAVSDELGLLAGDRQNGVAVMAIGNGPAQRFFNKGDIIVALNNTRIDSVSTLRKILLDRHPFWNLAILRNGQLIRLTING